MWVYHVISYFLLVYLITTFLKVECSNPSLLPEPGQRRSIEEPFVKVTSFIFRYLLLLLLFNSKLNHSYGALKINKLL